MSAESSGVFTLKEINRIKIIQDVIERRITTRRAAEHLGISDRQCRRLLARYREGGPLGMASRRCGMRGNRQLPPGLADQALELIKTRYADFGPTLAREKLEELLLPYSTYDRLSEIDQGAIVDNKRLGRTLEFISLVQSKRDNTRSQSIPAGDGPSRRRPKQEGKKSQRSLDNDDMLEALKQLQSRSEDIFGKRAR